MNVRRGALIGLWLWSVNCAAVFAQSIAVSVVEVEASLKAGNPQATLERYFDCQSDQAAYRGIASGSAPWIDLAERVLAFSDACYTEGIQAALGQAMQNAPQRVLPLVDKTATLATSYICLPFISSELPLKSQLTEIKRSQRAIQKVRDGSMQKQKASCLNFIASVKANLLQTSGAITQTHPQAKRPSFPDKSKPTSSPSPD